MTKPNVRVSVELANGITMSWDGDVEFLVTDETLTVHDYGLRDRNTMLSGIVLAAAPKSWVKAHLYPLADTTTKPPEPQG